MSRQEVVYKVSFKERVKQRFYDWLIDKLKKLILLAFSLVLIYVFVSFNADIMLAEFLLSNLIGVNKADVLYQYSSPYIRFLSYSIINKALGKLIPIKIPIGGGEK